MSYAAGAASVSMGWDWPIGWAGHGHGAYVQQATGNGIFKDNILYDGLGYCQIYGSSGSDFLDSTVDGNCFAQDGVVMGGLSDFLMTGSGERDRRGSGTLWTSDTTWQP